MLTEPVPTNWVFSRNIWVQHHTMRKWGSGRSTWSWLKACWPVKATSLGSTHVSVRLISFHNKTSPKLISVCCDSVAAICQMYVSKTQPHGYRVHHRDATRNIFSIPREQLCNFKLLYNIILYPLNYTYSQIKALVYTPKALDTWPWEARMVG